MLERFQELQRQEIYFAHPSELNDPYDGASEVHWTGDAIPWKNLLNHYLLCTVQAVVLATVLPDAGAIPNRITPSGTPDTLPSPEVKELYRRTFPGSHG